MTRPPDQVPAPSASGRRRDGSVAVGLLVAVNASVYVFQLVAAEAGKDLALPADPSEVRDRPWTVFTVMFFHDHLLHLAAMIGLLVVFGVGLGRAIGTRGVIGVYVASGLAGSLALVTASGLIDDGDPAVGSSAAVFGVVAALAALRPTARTAGGTTTQWVVVIVVVNVALFVWLPLGSFAHLAGVGTGLVAGWFLRTVDRGNERDAGTLSERLPGP